MFAWDKFIESFGNSILIAERVQETLKSRVYELVEETGVPGENHRPVALH